ncbi:MAG: serine hydrolase domain-containing protein [Clostridia bacterium]|nr:serine hydrolase domain-containing protein [Clostridia bacterium]
MNRLTRWLCALMAALSLSACGLPALAQDTPAAGEAEAPGLQDSAAAALAMQYGGASSIQWALFADGGIVSSGSLGAGEPGDETLLYGIGSVSKVYTAAAAMKLAEQGKLSLDESVTAYLPEFTMADERYRQITMRMLLNHSSGLMFAGMRDAFLFDDPQNTTAVDSLLTELSTQRLIADPGAYSVYCNTGFTLAQLVIERVSGMPLGDFMREMFFNPLALEDTYACQDDFDRTRLAPAYLPLDPARPVAADSTTITGTGGFYATARDLARFGGMLAGQSGLLSLSSLTAMAADEYARGMWPADSAHDMLSYGLGWDAVHMLPFSLSGIQALCKGGDTNLYHAALVVLPEYGMAAAVLSSGGVSTYNQLLAARLIIDALAAQGVTVAEEAILPAAQPAQMPTEMAALAGKYATSTAVVDVAVSPDGVLSLTQGEGEYAFTQTFSYHDDGSFRDETGTVLVRLVTESNGETYLFQQGYSPIPGLTLMGTACYACQRLEPVQDLDEDAQSAWAARDGKRYFMLNMRYNSQIYALAMPYTYVAFDEALPGYIGADRITGAGRAEAVVQIPGTGGRDALDIELFVENGLEYITAPGYLYVEEAAVVPLESRQSVTIGEDGYARWFSVTPALPGRTLTAVVPEHGSFSVYTEDAVPVAATGAYGDTGTVTAALPESGYVVFAGNPGETFEISVTE